jgi:hypothetical protein
VRRIQRGIFENLLERRIANTSRGLVDAGLEIARTGVGQIESLGEFVDRDRLRQECSAWSVEAPRMASRWAASRAS